MPDNGSAGATPADGGATPPQTPEPPAAAGTPPPATGEQDPDGMSTDAGREALRKERERAAKAEKALAELQRASQTETERAIADAKSTGEKEASERYANAIRRSEVRSALMAAGVEPSLLDLAVRADQFSGLEVTESGEVKGINAAVESLRKTTPTLFAKAKPNGSDAGLGPRGSSPSGGDDMNTYIRRAAGRA